VFEGYFLLGAVILISVVGNRLYEKTGLPESLFMILLGIIAGPATGLVPSDSLAGVVSYIFTLSLIVIILESGISTEISHTLDTMMHASVFTFTVLGISIAACGATLHFVFRWDVFSSVIMGVICSGTSTLPVIYMTERLDLLEKVKNLLVYESIFNDITLLTAMTLLLQAFSLEISPLQTFIGLLKYVTEPVIYGSFTAILWAYLLISYLREIQLKYISTLAVATILYAFTETEKGSGVLAILVFSVLLGNLHRIAKPSKIFSEKVTDTLYLMEGILKNIRGMQGEMSFLAKNFFFFIMGVMFNAEAVNRRIGVITLAMIGLIFVSRFTAASLMGLSDQDLRSHALLIASMLPRGLTASLASVMPENTDVVIPYLKEVILLMVFVTTLFTTGGFLMFHGRLNRRSMEVTA